MRRATAMPGNGVAFLWSRGKGRRENFPFLVVVLKINSINQRVNFYLCMHNISLLLHTYFIGYLLLENKRIFYCNEIN